MYSKKCSERSLKTRRNIEVHYLTCSAVTGHPDIGVLAVLVYFNIVLSTIAVPGSNYTGKYRPAVRHPPRTTILKYIALRLDSDSRQPRIAMI